ncbi:elongation of very long chain fatty acids protein [Plakobranchus ocellatus]|uniref:Elongation of very long chain fatty acids protein n=1 Tax=Plakobranchus ocellatus TaxID=259542 RepID=A0AAV4A321_9GAST|nr:elongation of very long chain fatty acids protein [Plakobranchus ocellatus]
MDLVKHKIVEFQEFYDWAFSVADERVADWPLMWGYTPTLAITALYLLAVYVGPRIMANREPIKLKYTLVVYNFICVLINFNICYELAVSSTVLGYSYSCQPVNYSYDPYEMRIAKALWWFYFSKCVEMLDTIFFIMRKKNNQVSFLHVYHHATMFPIWYIGVKWVAGGQSFFGAMINSFIHVLMYTYYAVAALGPEYQKYLWWKRYLTRLQLIQFVTGIIHALQSLAFNGCGFPEWMHIALIIYAFTILLLFLNFYFHAYLKAKSHKAKKIESNGAISNGHAVNGKSSKSDSEPKKIK